MKTYTFLFRYFVLFLFSLINFAFTRAQTYIDKEFLYIYLNDDGGCSIFIRNETTTISMVDKDGEMHLMVESAGKQHYYPVSNIQSISFLYPKNDNYKPLNITNTPTFGTAIDLGLPSGLKWASFNVGATKPEECGGYFAWGETKEKNIYSASNYLYAQESDEFNASWCNPDGLCWRWIFTAPKVTNDGIDISGTEYDVAHVNWGGSWRMPTIDDFRELYYNCISRERVSYNGVNGWMFIGKNGNSIFLPAAGGRYDGEDGNVRENGRLGQHGYYWSSNGWFNGFDSGLYLLLWEEPTPIREGFYMTEYPFHGFSVRPVTEK